MFSEQINKLKSFLEENTSALFLKADYVLEELTSGHTCFELKFQFYFDESAIMETVVYFQQSMDGTSYYVSKYNAILKYPDSSETDKLQTFYRYNNGLVSFAEAYNLLQRRAVYYQRSPFPEIADDSWVQVNFREKDKNGNYKVIRYSGMNSYHLEMVLEKYPIKELKDSAKKKQLIHFLKKGDMLLVSFEKKKGTEKLFIAANPCYKTLTIYPYRTEQKLKYNATFRYHD